MNLLEKRIAKYRLKLSDNDVQILKDINKYYEEIPDSSMKDLADRCYTSISTLHRIVLKIGFEGFSDFKIRISDDMYTTKLDQTLPFDEDDYLNTYLNDIRLTKRLNETEIKKVAEIILKKKYRYCFGTGWKQKQVIDNFSNDLLYYGESFITLRTENDLRMAVDSMNEDSLLIVLSLSGNIENYGELIEACKLKNVVIVSITSDRMNSLSDLSDYSLYYKENVLDNIDKHWNINTLNFLTNYLIECVVHQKTD